MCLITVTHKKTPDKLAQVKEQAGLNLQDNCYSLGDTTHPYTLVSSTRQNL